MPNYTVIFENLGAFARVRSQFDQIATNDVNIVQGSENFRSLDNLASRFVTLMNDTPDERRLLTAVDRLRTLGTTVDASWPGIKSILDSFLTGPVADDLAIGGSPSDIVRGLARQMDTDAQSVQQNAVGISAISADANNSGTGSAYVSILAPGFDDTTHNSQLVKAQSMVLEVESDSPNDGLTLGKERWAVRSNEGLAASASSIPVTAGATEDARNLVIDGSFTLFNAGSFDHFTETGAAIFTQNTSDYLFDATSLAINGTGAGTLTQIVSDRSTPPAGGVLVALGVHRKITSITAGTLTLQLVADSTPLAATIVYNSGSPTGSWGHDAIFAFVPRSAFPKELKLEIVSDGTFNGNLLLDGLSIGVADSVGDGVSLAAFQGVEAFSRLPSPDRFTFNTTSDEAGDFANFVRNIYGIELPVSGAPTIDDTLAV